MGKKAVSTKKKESKRSTGKKTSKIKSPQSDLSENIKPKRGRPPKSSKKRRGRPPKPKTAKTLKRRGRKNPIRETLLSYNSIQFNAFFQGFDWETLDLIEAQIKNVKKERGL